METPNNTTNIELTDDITNALDVVEQADDTTVAPVSTFSTIRTARQFERNGKQLICFNGNIVVSLNQVKQETGLVAQFTILVGGRISAKFYEVGEVMRNNAECTKAGMIVKEFSIELPKELLAFKRMAALGMQMVAA